MLTSIFSSGTINPTAIARNYSTAPTANSVEVRNKVAKRKITKEKNNKKSQALNSIFVYISLRNSRANKVKEV